MFSLAIPYFYFTQLLFLFQHRKKRFTQRFTPNIKNLFEKKIFFCYNNKITNLPNLIPPNKKYE